MGYKLLIFGSLAIGIGAIAFIINYIIRRIWEKGKLYVRIWGTRIDFLVAGERLQSGRRKVIFVACADLATLGEHEHDIQTKHTYSIVNESERPNGEFFRAGAKLRFTLATDSDIEWLVARWSPNSTYDLQQWINWLEIHTHISRNELNRIYQAIRELD
jgi:hypothetical protein